MQDRNQTARQKPLATHGRTIHSGSNRLPRKQHVAKPLGRLRRSDRYGAACVCGPLVGRSEFIDKSRGGPGVRLRAPPTEEALNHRDTGQTIYLAKRTKMFAIVQEFHSHLIF